MASRHRDLVTLIAGYGVGLTAGIAIGLLIAPFDFFLSLRRGRLSARLPVESLATEAMTVAKAPPPSRCSRLLALPTELVMRILAELSVCELALMSAVSREFRDSLVQQALTFIAPTLSGLGGPRRPSLARSELALHLARGEVVQGKGMVAPRPTEMSVRQVSEWASDLSDDESVLTGMLAPGEYHYIIRTTDDEESNTYYAFGALSLFADGTCRGSAIEMAPDGLQAAFTRNGLWRSGSGFWHNKQVVNDMDLSGGAASPSGASVTPSPNLRDPRRSMIRFDYDYAGEIYEYRLLAHTCVRPSTRGHDVSTCGGSILPTGTRQYGPQLVLSGRWARRDNAGEWASPIERGAIRDCRLWRAEWVYELLPDDPTRIEARHGLRAEMLGMLLDEEEGLRAQAIAEAHGLAAEETYES